MIYNLLSAKKNAGEMGFETVAPNNNNKRCLNMGVTLKFVFLFQEFD